MAVCCDRFADSWRVPPPHRIEEEVDTLPERLRPRLFRELLGLELDMRRGRGETPTVEEYVARFPDRVTEVISVFAPTEEGDHPLVLDRYEVLGRLGAGGMGEVYKARQLVMGRVVALKVLTAQSVNSPEKVHRFRQETKAIGRLHHPNIVTAYDAGQAAEVHFLAMEYVDGEDLSRMVARRGPLPLAEAVDAMAQAARGLAYAHEQGVIHRDIKPSNLIRAHDGTVKVLDLGLARLRPLSDSNDPSTTLELSKEGGFLGTPFYTSPEQAFDPRHVDHRTDIYGLGCTLYYLLTGRPPYRGDSAMSTLLAHKEAPVPTLEASQVHAPPWLDQAFQRMVAKDPAERFATMDEVVKGLTAYPLSEPSRPESTQEITEDHPEGVASTVDLNKKTLATKKAPPPFQRRRAWVALVGLALLSIGGFLAFQVIKVITSKGTIVVTVDQPGCEISVVEDRVTITSGPGEEPVQVEVSPGKRTLVVKKGGFHTETQEFTLTSRERRPIRVELVRKTAVERQ